MLRTGRTVRSIARASRGDAQAQPDGYGRPLMEAFLVLLFIALIAGAAFVYMRGRKEAAAGPAGPAGLPQAPAPEPIGGADVRALKLGDVVNYEGRDWIVEGTLRFDQGGFRWARAPARRRQRLAVAVGRGRRGPRDRRLEAPARRGARARPGHARARRRDLRARRARQGELHLRGRRPAPAGGGKAEFADYAKRRQAAVLRALRRRRRLGDLRSAASSPSTCSTSTRAAARELSDALADAEATERGLREQIADLVHARARADSEAARLADRATLAGAHDELAREIAGRYERQSETLADEIDVAAQRACARPRPSSSACARPRD